MSCKILARGVKISVLKTVNRHMVITCSDTSGEHPSMPRYPTEATIGSVLNDHLVPSLLDHDGALGLGLIYLIICFEQINFRGSESSVSNTADQSPS